MSLVLGSKTVSRADVRKVVTPEQTGSHFPIPHSVERVNNDGMVEAPEGLLEMVEQGLLDAGFSIEDESHVLARDGQRYFGGLRITREDLASKERQMVCGIRNSHDKAFASAICIGSQMMVCSNLCFSSEQVLARKHTKFILRDLPDVINKVIASLLTEWHSMADRIDAYKRVYLTSEEASLLFNRLAEKKALPESKTYKAFKVWLDPSIAAKGMVELIDYTDDFDNFDQEAYDNAILEKGSDLRTAFGCGNSLWGVYNAVTEILKGSNAQELPNRTMKMQVILDEFANYSAKTVGEEVANNGTGDVDQDQENFKDTFGDDDDGDYDDGEW